MARIDSGAVEASDKFQDVPKAKWRALLGCKRSFLAVRLNYDCRCLVEFCEEAEAVWKDLDFKSAEDMIRSGYELDPVEIELAVAWIKHNEPDAEVSLPEVSAAVKAEQRGTPKNGNNQHSGFSNTKPTMDDATYACRRLLRDRPDLFEKVKAGELSPNAAAIKAGFRKQQISVPVGDAETVARRLLKHYSRQELLDALDATEGPKT